MTVPLPVDPLRRQLFLVVHDPFTGRPLVRPSSVGCGLVAAVIAELVLDGRVRTADEVTPRVLAEAVLGAAGPPERADELPALAQRMTARGLVADGVVRQESSRGLLGRDQPRYPAVDLVRAVRPRRHLERVLDSRRPLTVPEAVLVGLVDAIGAGSALDLAGGARALRARAEVVTREIPAPLCSLVTGLARSPSGAALLRR